jgi:hypothetical protein
VSERPGRRIPHPPSRDHSSGYPRAVARTSALLVLALAGSTLVAGCGDDEGPKADRGDDAPEFSLVVTREDGSTLAFDEFTITCDPRFYDGESPRGEMVEVRSQPDPNKKHVGPYFFIQAVVPDVERGGTFEFGPGLEFVYDDPEGVDFVVADGRAQEPFVVGGEGSEGTITVTSATCSPQPAIELELSGTLANEAEDASVEVSGRIDVSG